MNGGHVAVLDRVDRRAALRVSAGPQAMHAHRGVLPHHGCCMLRNRLAIQRHHRQVGKAVVPDAHGFPEFSFREAGSLTHRFIHERDGDNLFGRCTFSRSIPPMTPNQNPTRSQAAANTRKLIEWAIEAVNKPLLEPVRRRAAIILSDDIGAMVAGSLETQVARAREGLLRTSSGKSEATVLAKGAPRADRYAAASANGMAIAWCELDEGFRGASCHAGAYTIPALLAEAEAQGRTVDEVLRALAVAYEVTTRFALAFPFPVFNVHPHAAFAAIGGAAAAALVRRQDAATLLSAVTGAASMSFAGPFDTAVEGALIRNAWTSAGALGTSVGSWSALQRQRNDSGRTVDKLVCRTRSFCESNISR